MHQMPSVDDLAAAARSAGDIGAQLERAIAISRELGALGDDLVERFVSEAREAGMSWAQIGALFGTSKQAAQKRYASASGWPGRLADPARRALDRAAELARELGHNYVGTEHVLVALIETQSGLAAHALADLGVAREGVVAKLSRAGAPRPYDCLGVDPRLKQALELAGRQAERLGHRQTNTEHVLIGLVQVPDAAAVTLLTGLGISTDEVRATLAARLGVDVGVLTPPRRRRGRLRGAVPA